MKYFFISLLACIALVVIAQQAAVNGNIQGGSAGQVQTVDAATARYMQWRNLFVGTVGFTNQILVFTNTGAAGDFVQISQSNLTSGGVIGAYQLISTNFGSFGTSAAVTEGTSGITNALSAQFNYLNLQRSTNCGWGIVVSNGTAGTTVTLLGYEEFVVSAGATAIQLGDATTNAGHHVSITCGSTGTNGIFTVASQKIAGKAGGAGVSQWTNTAIFTCTQLISDGANWQICGTRGN